MLVILTPDNSGPALTSCRTRGSAQAGYALLLFLLLIITGLAAALLSYARTSSQQLTRDQITAAALAQAKTALIGEAADDLNRPGSLPCPDQDNNGQLDLGVDFSGNSCVSYIGRLPWKTLGLPDLRDGSGERLWYALSPNFRDYSAAGPLNSDTNGILTITGISPAAQIIAIVFAPGPAVGIQLRDAANQNNVANYLDGINTLGGNTNIYTTGPATDIFNDRLLEITSDALFPAVTMRVAREAKLLLNKYYTNYNYFPNAASYASSSCDPNLTQGRIPLTIANTCPKQQEWGPSIMKTWKWFFDNNWHQVAHYAVAPACVDPMQPNCTGTGFLTVIGAGASNPTVEALTIVTGRAYTGQARPCAVVADCLEAPENTNTDNVYLDARVTPSTNDRLMVVAP